jgi:hypothetical protein
VDGGLYGKVRGYVENGYNNVAWDSIKGEVVSPSLQDISSQQIVLYNENGYLTSIQRNIPIVTGATNDGTWARVTEVSLKPNVIINFLNDVKNRRLEINTVGYQYNATVGGVQIWGSVGDSTSVIDNTPFNLAVTDTIVVNKEEYTYDDVNKIAIVVYSQWNGSSLEAIEKYTYTLNSEGYIDQNSTYKEYDIVSSNTVQFQDKPRTINYNDRDEKGNWVRYYEAYRITEKNYYISSYLTREIAYY